MEEKIIYCGEQGDEPGLIFNVGGKGINLLGLYYLYKRKDIAAPFFVPDFFIIPPTMKLNSVKIMDAFDKLSTPVAVRSSSCLEDSVVASFAGRFDSFLGIGTYGQLLDAAGRVRQSALNERALDYAKRLGIKLNEPEHFQMPVIVQEEITEFLRRGTLQIEKDSVIIESVDKKGRENRSEFEIEYLDEFYLVPKPIKDYECEGTDHILANAARKAKDLMNLEGVVQVEFCLVPEKLPGFVQIRSIPEVKQKLSLDLDLDVPEGVPYIESKVCNGVPGEVVLPAYVTFSQAGFQRVAIGCGLGACLGPHMESTFDKRMEEFLEKSKLNENVDFNQIMNFKPNEPYISPLESRRIYRNIWERGNSLFSEYVLVCDKLDESVFPMEEATTRKRAIITCCEEKTNSHAMTVARDLGIMCMGVNEPLWNMDYFFHQVQTGDLVHMKSDGKRAVAYVERRRAVDPYERFRGSD